jgi:hypothetical protein
MRGPEATDSLGCVARRRRPPVDARPGGDGLPFDAQTGNDGLLLWYLSGTVLLGFVSMVSLP